MHARGPLRVGYERGGEAYNLQFIYRRTETAEQVGVAQVFGIPRCFHERHLLGAAIDEQTDAGLSTALLLTAAYNAFDEVFVEDAVRIANSSFLRDAVTLLREAAAGKHVSDELQPKITAILARFGLLHP